MFPENFILYSIQILLVVVMIAMIIVVIRSYLLHRQPIFKRFGLGMLIGFITDFGDTLGIGSFATTTAAFRMTHYIDDDRKLPGTLNAVHAIPVMFQALFFITAVKVELTTLLPMTTAAVIGAYVGTHVTKMARTYGTTCDGCSVINCCYYHGSTYDYYPRK